MSTKNALYRNVKESDSKIPGSAPFVQIGAKTPYCSLSPVSHVKFAHKALETELINVFFNSVPVWSAEPVRGVLPDHENEVQQAAASTQTPPHQEHPHTLYSR